MSSIKKRSSNATKAAIIGTVLEYYDMALYGLMAPLLVAVFLPTFDKLNALILTYILPCIGIVIRPLGALLIGKIGDKHGRKRGLVVSIGGMAVVTGMIGLMPTYDQIGFAAPILFLVLRSLQGFFLAGEYNGGAIFVLEHNQSNRRGYFSGLYSMYTVVGILLAAAVCTVTSKLPQGYWRLPYLIGSLTGIVGLYIRHKVHESPKFLEHKDKDAVPLKDIAKKYKLILLSISVTVFFTVMCVLPNTLMISLLPIATSYSLSTVMTVNTISTAVHLIVLPIFGNISDNISFNKSMRFAAFAILVMAYPLVSTIHYNRLDCIIIMKVSFSILSGWFIAPFHAWIQGLFHTRERYTAISFIYSIGSQIGGAMIPLSLWGWKQMHTLSLVYGIIMFWAVVALIVLRYQKSQTVHD